MSGQGTAGTALAARLREKMHASREGVTSLAQRLHVSQSYLSELLRGDRPMQGLRDEVIREIAAYLEVPPVVCFLMAEKLRHADFVAPPTSWTVELNKAMEVLAASPQGLEAVVTAEDLKGLPEPAKRLLVALYEYATGSPVLRVTRWSWTGSGQPAAVS
ncbi:helix-turn-helix domain-containing protein [Aromatoleum petrolei]|uniref:Helix-turn-helix domain-containing protein n=1 Tax=Aromatoleum petrolei TaxID=76116 RepID=A0ABX1MKT1_9RHOO|nr:helix-turn-helix transcriptional regulator [Aromatoleum petrolei]NMF86936.1 helix-turn-helix domain-containing protein [Aromatoleum petrolei]QTQ37530.1 Uncharacterized protein ToN1_34120 [Aromatoleum petrolei]